MVERPDLSTKRCSLETGLSKTSVWRILTADLGMAPYHMHVVQALTDCLKPVRVQCTQVLAEMANIDPEVVNLVAFSDEATFHTSCRVNLHNTIVWGEQNPRVILSPTFPS